MKTKSIGLNEDLNKEIDFDLICKGFHSGEISSIDIAIQRPLLITCSKQDSTIRLWNYKTFTCEMAREYYVVEDMSMREAARPLISVAIHPGGYYMAASFIDKIRFHHILHDEFQYYANIDVKNCKIMKFSSGGHFFACVEGRNILVYNAYTLKKMKTIEMVRAPEKTEITQLVFNNKDVAIGVCGNNGYVGRWRIPSFEVIKEEAGRKNMSYNSLDFIYDENQSDPNILALAGHLKDLEAPKDNNKLKVLSLSYAKDTNKDEDLFSEKLDALGKYT